LKTVEEGLRRLKRVEECLRRLKIEGGRRRFKKIGEKV